MASLGSQGYSHSSIGSSISYYQLRASSPCQWIQQYSYSNAMQCRESTPSHITHNWSINDEHLPEINEYDEFYEWIDGYSKCIFLIDICNKKKCFRSGWPMRNSNNHKIDILKKSCVGVHLCTSCGAYVYPAISESARKSQTDCPIKNCSGKLLYIPCRGNKGHPVTHSWRRVGKNLYFEAIGTHDHPKPIIKVSRMRKRRKDSYSQLNIETTIQESGISTSSSACFLNAASFPHSIPPIDTNVPMPTLPRAPGFNTETPTSSSTGSFYQQHIMSSFPQDYPIEYPQFHLRNSGNIQSDTSISEPSIPQRYSNSSSSNDPWSFNNNDRQIFYNSPLYPPNPDFIKYPPVYNSDFMKCPPTEKSDIPLQPPIREYEYGHWRNG